MQLETERLRMRPFVMDDLTKLMEFYQDEETMRYFDGIKFEDEAKHQLMRTIDAYMKPGLASYGFLAVILKSTNQLVGRCGLIKQTVLSAPEVEVAYLIDRLHWNQGLATEAAQRLRDYALDDLSLKRVVSIIHKENKPSIRVAQKNGMTWQTDLSFHNLPCELWAVSK